MEFGEEASGVFELAPLRRRDVAEAAIVNDIDPDAFVRELYAANAVPFAIKPLTLNMLLDLYQRDGSLPSSSGDLYTQGCLKLCEEQSKSRRDTRRLGRSTPAQRLRLAGRVAAATMFGNRYAIWKGAEIGRVPPKICPYPHSRAVANRAPFQLSMSPATMSMGCRIRACSAPGGGDRMGWAHQSYAEFLAPDYLVEKAVSPDTILKVLLHPAGGLVPQLSTVAAWAASLNSAVRMVYRQRAACSATGRSGQLARRLSGRADGIASRCLRAKAISRFYFRHRGCLR